MRTCPICRLALRINDPSGWCDCPEGNKHGARPGNYASVCSECAAHYRPAAERTPYLNFVIDCQSGLGTTTHSCLVRANQDRDGILANAPAGLCGLCRRFAREDDTMEAMRLYREDFDTPEEADRVVPPQDQAACYMVCRECREKWKPKILARLKRLKLVPESLPVQAMGAAMLC